MSVNSVKGFRLTDGSTAKYDYAYLENIITDKELIEEDVAADGKAVGDAIEELEAELSDVKADLANISEPTRNINDQKMGRWRARASGAIVTETSQLYWGMKDMVPCDPDTDYTVSCGNVSYSGTLHIFITWYDSNKNVISQEDNATGTSAVNTSPSTASYIYANLYNNSGITVTDSSWLQVEKGNTPTNHVLPYAPKGVTENAELLDGLYTIQNVQFPYTAGYLSLTSGRISGTSTSWKTSEFISLRNIHKIVVNNTANTNYIAAIAYYTADKQYISGEVLTNYTIVANISNIPTTAYYARICTVSTGSATIYKVETIAQTEQDKIIESLQSEYNVNFIDRKYIKISDGQEAPSNDWKITPFINIENVYSVTVKSIRNTNVSYITFYDSDKGFISGILPTAETELHLYKAMFPVGAVYVRLCISKTDVNAYAYYTYKTNAFQNTLKYMCFGDSITSDEVCGIGTIIAQELNAVHLGNFGHGNATLSDWHTGNVNNTVQTPNITPDTAYNANVLSNQVRNALAYATDAGDPVSYTHPVAGTITLDTSIWEGTGSSENVPDIIYIAIGTNDGGDETPVENNADIVNQQTYSALDRCSYASSLRWALETLIAKFPYAEIYVATPLHTAEHRMNGKRAYDVMNLKADLIKNVCRFCSVNVIDSYANSGVSSAMEDEFFGSDGLHPVAKWRGYIARYVANKIKQNYIQRP